MTAINVGISLTLKAKHISDASSLSISILGVFLRGLPQPQIRNRSELAGSGHNLKLSRDPLKNLMPRLSRLIQKLEKKRLHDPVIHGST